MSLEFDLGWYHIDEIWNLYIDGDLQKYHVEFINVDEKAGTTDEYVVSHFDKTGKLTTKTLDAEDLNHELRGRETTDRPAYV